MIKMSLVRILVPVFMASRFIEANALLYSINFSFPTENKHRRSWYPHKKFYSIVHTAVRTCTQSHSVVQKLHFENVLSIDSVI